MQGPPFGAALRACRAGSSACRGAVAQPPGMEARRHADLVRPRRHSRPPGRQVHARGAPVRMRGHGAVAEGETQRIEAHEREEEVGGAAQAGARGRGRRRRDGRAGAGACALLLAPRGTLGACFETGEHVFATVGSRADGTGAGGRPLAAYLRWLSRFRCKADCRAPEQRRAGGQTVVPSEDQTSIFVRTRSMTASVKLVVPSWPPRSGVRVPAPVASSTAS